ncbi:hypothetical protein DR76_4913 (plasmid) [Escherichia coli ATCC 25922]|nr:hypothetical protein DR76_4913 [Escherichia coli ATCC 25922]
MNQLPFITLFHPQPKLFEAVRDCILLKSKSREWFLSVVIMLLRISARSLSIYLSEYSLNIFSSCNMVSASAVGSTNLISARFLNVAAVSLW